MEANMSPKSKEIYLDLLKQQRQWLLKKNQEDKHMDEDVIRKHLHKIDIEEEKLRYI
jgi:CPA1 family monovalent cation:H+ antiporter